MLNVSWHKFGIALKMLLVIYSTNAHDNIKFGVKTNKKYILFDIKYSNVLVLF